ncbi:MAG: hypothetical protein KBT18_13750 [Comamonas sp.]|nr:hypothetical protein [Candidatus Comamonas equi]
MTLQWKLSVQAGLCAAALVGAGWVQAQTPNPTESQAVPAQSEAAPTQQHMPKPGKHHPKHSKKHHRSSAGKYATPQQHEAAAVRQEHRHGKGPAHADQMTDLQRNALRRCDVFKTNEDRMACVERVRQPQISGSVESGGIIREYTQTVRVDAPPMPAMQPGQQYQAPQYQAPQPQPHPHMVHPQVQPMRPQ